MSTAEDTGALVVPPSRLRIAVAVLGVALTVAATLLVASWSTSPYGWLDGLARGLTVGTPIAVGLYAYGRLPFRRFGMLLVGLGVAWFFVTLSNSPDELVYSVGRVAGWVTEVAIVYVVLAFPTGRLTSRTDALVVGVLAAVVAVLYLPTALLVDSYPVPSPFATCTGGCPGNAFDVVGQRARVRHGLDLSAA